MEETKHRLKQMIKDEQDEEKIMQWFQQEKERLAYEREELLDCIKVISSDISQMDQMINQTEDERMKNFETTKKLIEEYRQRKNRINKLRAQISLPNLENDNFLENLDIQDTKNGHLIGEWPTSQLGLREQMLNNSALSMLNKTVAKPLATKTNAGSLNFGHHHSDQNLSTLGERRAERTLSTSANFLQQPPPMKQCMTCNQQIHRNAPICPYCKAKSRSRNPKKPKKQNKN